MTSKQYPTANDTLERLSAINWMDWDRADSHAQSRTALLREYLRRAAFWARELGGSTSWPFFDIAKELAPSFSIPEELSVKLETLLENNVPGARAERVCQASVHWAALREAAPAKVSEMEDPFAPLITLYERGGIFVVENSVADFVFSRVRLTNWEDHISDSPVVELNEDTLNQLDAHQ
ncbi:hypothetical protein [Streptomyces sp. NPDC026589]|uniref:hypothetical protein n=1 Tax=Streptomyces sp. NPDC026589 TaxID=3155609 RepID=UPI0033E9FE2F